MLTETDFAFLRRFLKRRSGLDLGAEKRYLAESRLGPVWRDAGLSSLAELIARLRTAEERDLADATVFAMATHETMFFRDRQPFEDLRTTILPRLLEARADRRRLRIWSAAASTGQEAYSVAMILREMGAALDGWTVEILGTDISPAAIERARAGSYSSFEVQRGLPVRCLLAHFSPDGLAWTISPELREAVQFRVLNLLDFFGHLGRFDLILCRNLAIYLDGPTKTSLFERLADALLPGGLLCLGGTETILGYTRALVPDPHHRGFFIRPDAAGAASIARQA